MRIDGWERLLSDHIASVKPFEWGTNDCALWSSDWVHKATGRDLSIEWRGNYSSEAELNVLFAKRGIETPADIPAKSGLPEIHPAFAQRGDIMLHPQGCLGICNGLWSCFLTETRMTRFLTTKCDKAWKVS